VDFVTEWQVRKGKNTVRWEGGGVGTAVSLL
jgi:hypothetical protein